MNIFFHLASAVAVVVLITDTAKLKNNNSKKQVIWIALSAFIVSIIAHGALDYIPHCYPIHSILDVVFGSIIIVITTWLANKKYRIIVFAALIGSIFPDLVDHLPRIVNKHFQLNIPILPKIFPWHFIENSGSIYTNECNNSTFNHILLMITILIFSWSRRSDVKLIFKQSK
jgi:hypothetical protein